MKAVRIIQLTDLHVMADPEAELKGIRPRARLEHVLQALQDRYARAERLVITGDLTHDQRFETYQDLRKVFAEWIGRLRMIPGNHDDRAAMREVFRDCVAAAGERVYFHEQLGGWNLIGLDSQLAGEVRGRLGSEQLAWLEQQIAAAAEQPTCVFVHHPPVPVNSPWLDRIGLEDSAELLDILRKRPNVRIVVSGHVHQDTTTIDATLAVVTTRPTSVPFRPETEVLEVDTAGIGFRILDLLSDGSVRTRVERVTVS